MKKVPVEHGTGDRGLTEEADVLQRQFEAAWQEALAGAPPPQVETYLAQASEVDRPTLLAHFERIERDYRQRHQSAGPTTEVIADHSLGDPHPLSAATLDLPAVGPDQTIEHVSAEVPVEAATLTLPPKDLPADPAEVSTYLRSAHRGEGPEAVPSSADNDQEEGPRVPGYEILGVLGRGGMGVVYKARQVKLNRLVALKMVLAGAHAGPLQLARFYTEAEAVARLQHPGIVQIFEVGEHAGLPFFSLEFVEGGSLGRKIKGLPQPPREAADIVAQLAQAMAVAHERGIIHRDLKPANILLTADGTPKITDFGLAKRIEDDSNQTKSGTLMGTPSYMAPEQARGETHEIGPLADLYSLGAILYELLTGRPPFLGLTLWETIVQVREQEPVPPTHLQPKCPCDLETICLKCLQKEPQKRYASCQALADDLDRFLAGEPIRARPVGRIERAWRWCVRNPRVAALSACVGVLLLVVIAALSIMGIRLAREREAVAATRQLASKRLEQAAAAVAAGNYQEAGVLLRWSDPLLLSNPDLGDARDELETLKAQVDVYAQFRNLLDSARFACRFGSRRQKEEGHRQCHQLLALYDEIAGRSGRGAAGLPPLNALQQQLFKEDVFEAFLTAAQVEQELAHGKGKAAERQAAQQAIACFERAEQILPGTRALRIHRAPCWATLGNHAASRTDREKGASIPIASAVDRFWHGFALHLRGDQALRKDIKAAHEFYRQAMAEYASFLELRPDHFWGYFNWANCHAQLNDRPDRYDALIGFTACMRLRPDFPWPYNNRGTVHLRLGQPALAIADFTTALARNRDYPEAHANRGLAYRALGKTDLALTDFTRAIALNPDYAPAYTERAEIYRQRKQHALAVEDYTRLLELGEDRAPLLRKRAAAYRALNQPEQASQDYAQLIKLNPRNLQARAGRAELFLAGGRYADARAEFLHILKLAPREAVIWRARAIVNWQNLKDFPAALADFEQFARLMPKDPEPHRCRGAILLGLRHYGPALQALQQALALRPGYPEANWARAQILLWQGRPAEALPELDALVAKLPQGPPETLNVRAGVHEALGQLGKAAADYRRMIEVKPLEPEAYVCLARLYSRQGQEAQARECLDRLVKAAPQSAWAHLRRAEYRRDQGEYDAALDDCARAARLGPAGWAVPALVRASVLAARGQRGPALAEAERALEKAPRHDGHVLYAAACVWSLACRGAEPAEARRWGERAASLLAEALDKGFHDLIYPEHNRMPGDPALASIRLHPRVRDLLSRKEKGREKR
jgi:tetratricopeptide (TPR) repeat protein/tRNA A-37 threonylcarbamoyl transferase component Bud32